MVNPFDPCDPCCNIQGGFGDKEAARVNYGRLLCQILGALSGSPTLVGLRSLTGLFGWCVWDDGFTTEAGSTASVLNVTGHDAIPGYLIQMTGGQNWGIQAIVTGIGADTIDISPPLPYAPANGDSFTIFNPDAIQTNCDGSLNINLKTSDVTLETTIVPGSINSNSSSLNATGPTGAFNIGPSMVGMSEWTVQIGSVGGTATAWSIDLEGSYDGGTTWGKILTHTKLSEGEYGFKFAEAFGMTDARLNCIGLTLGTASDVAYNIKFK